MYCSEVTTIKTRKGYRCLWCWEHMPKGSEVKRWACFDGGSASTVRMHDECYEAMLRWYTHWDDELPIPGTYPRGCCCEDRECKDCKEYVNSTP